MARNPKTANLVSALLSGPGGSPTRVSASVIKLTLVRRAGRALAGLGKCWGVAVFTVLIPIAHFVLVPAFLIAGIVVGIRRLREDRMLVHVHATCRRCGADQDFRKRGGSGDQWALECDSCGNQLLLAVDQGQQTSDAA